MFVRLPPPLGDEDAEFITGTPVKARKGNLLL